MKMYIPLRNVLAKLNSKLSGGEETFFEFYDSSIYSKGIN